MRNIWNFTIEIHYDFIVMFRLSAAVATVGDKQRDDKK